MSVELGDENRLQLTLGEKAADEFLQADGAVGEVVERAGPNTFLVDVDTGDETEEIMVAEHELRPVRGVADGEVHPG